MLTREQLLSKKAPSTKVPLEDDFVLIKHWNGHDRAAFVDASLDEDHGMSKGQRNEYLNALVMQMSVVDEEGNYIFTIDDIEAIQNTVDSHAIDRIVKEALALNGIATEAIGEAEKKSEETPSSDST